jgi:hypothetical protein
MSGGVLLLAADARISSNRMGTLILAEAVIRLTKLTMKVQYTRLISIFS